MQFLSITKSTTLSDLSKAVGTRNVDVVLSTNSLTRSPNIGKQFEDLCNGIAKGLPATSTEARKWVSGTAQTVAETLREGWVSTTKAHRKGVLVIDETASAAAETVKDGYTRIYQSGNQVMNWAKQLSAEAKEELFGSDTVPELNRNSVIVEDKDWSFSEAVKNDMLENPRDVSPKRKMTLLNTLTSDGEAYEKACLMSEDNWRVFSALNTFDGALKIPETVQMSPSASLIGSNTSVSKVIYERTMRDLQVNGEIDPVIFSDYSTRVQGKIDENFGTTGTTTNLFEAFNLPWGDIQLYSSLADETIDFPVYPEEIEYSRVANYTTMNETLFQYEPWQIYESSGPREQTFTFVFHRDMWSGDHRDGKANELVRFCEANCYPEYDGAAVNTATVTLYIKGTAHITGIITNVATKWSGPLGLDGWYLQCELSITITEVASSPLSFSTVRKMNVIGGYGA